MNFRKSHRYNLFNQLNNIPHPPQPDTPQKGFLVLQFKEYGLQSKVFIAYCLKIKIKEEKIFTNKFNGHCS